MKKNLKKCAFLGLFSYASIFGLNTLIERKAEGKNVLGQQGRFFRFRNTDVYYTVRGTGEPLLLIHDLLPQSCSYEWEKVKRRLEKTNRVYALDLPGCGRSEKPWLTYTTFYFTECIHEFIDKVIREKAIVAASGASAFPAILTDKMYPEDMKKLILVNPERLAVSEQTPDNTHKLVKYLLHLPLMGRFIYNIEMSEANLGSLFREVYYYRKSAVDGRVIAAYYEASHKKNDNGRHLLASIRGRYLNANVRNALSSLSNLCLIMSRDRKGGYTITKEYQKAAKNIETAQISGSRTLPQLETPEKLAEVMKLFL